MRPSASASLPLGADRKPQFGLILHNGLDAAIRLWLQGCRLVETADIEEIKPGGVVRMVIDIDTGIG